MRSAFRATSNQSSIFLVCDASSGRRVGLELAASTNTGDLQSHAKRTYPSELQLDQYVVVHFVPDLNDNGGPFFSVGEKKDGEACQVPVDTVVHDQEFRNVRLLYKEQADQAVINT